MEVKTGWGERGKFNSCLRDVHVFLFFAAAQRQFGPGRCCLGRCEGGILLDAETAECNTGKDGVSVWR